MPAGAVAVGTAAVFDTVATPLHQLGRSDHITVLAKDRTSNLLN